MVQPEDGGDWRPLDAVREIRALLDPESASAPFSLSAPAVVRCVSASGCVVRVRTRLALGARVEGVGVPSFFDVAGTKTVPVEATTVFKSVGIAIEDLATARLVYDAVRASAGGRGA